MVDVRRLECLESWRYPANDDRLAEPGRPAKAGTGFRSVVPEFDIQRQVASPPFVFTVVASASTKTER